MRRLALVPLFTLILASCGDASVDLAYSPEPGQRLSYQLRLEADIERSLQGETRSERIVASFRAGQEVVEDRGDLGAVVRMTLDPIALTVDEEPVNVGSGQEFLVTLGTEGEVEQVEEVTQGLAEALAPVGIERLLPRLRPVLPGREVGPGETWSSDTRVADDAGTFSVAARSRLAELGTVGGVPAALVRTTYDSPVDRQEIFANAIADLRGRDLGTQEAWFSLEGFLLRATGDSEGTFDLTFRPPGGAGEVAPVEGTLRVRLHTEMELLR